jgi:hypothetical protein
MARGSKILQPMIESEFGALPDFGMCAFKGDADRRGVPFWIPSSRKLQIKYHRQTIDDLLKEGSFYYLWVSLTHELLHIYNTDTKDPDSWSQLSHWSEGVSQLAAFTLNDRLIASDKAGKCLSQLFGSRQKLSSAGLKRFTVDLLAYDLAYLRRAKVVRSASAAANALPFAVPRAAINLSDEFMPQSMEGLRHHYPYIVGMYRCGRIVSGGRMTLRQLIFTPITNRRLRHLANRIVLPGEKT